MATREVTTNGHGATGSLILPAGVRSVPQSEIRAQRVGRMKRVPNRVPARQGPSQRQVVVGDPFGEIGTSGLRQYGGFVLEEWLARLRGRYGAWAYREMMDNSPIAAGIIFAIKMLAREVDWPVVDDIPIKAPEVDGFVESCMHDMSHTWGDFVSEALSMIGYGWSFHESNYKRRQGGNPLPETWAAEPVDVVSGNPQREGTEDIEPPSSKYNDGKIGWRSLPVRAQETTFRWIFHDYAGLRGMEQIDWHGGKHKIPISKALLFRTETTRQNPEGRSLLRSAWTSYFALQNIQQIEAIGIERDLAGLPLAKPPEGVDLNDPAHAELFQSVKELVQGVRRDEDEGVVLPSSEWEFELLSSGGSRQIDTDAVIRRYEQRMTVSLLADFLILGQDGMGSYAMVDVKSEFFGVAVEVLLDLICEVINRYAIPRLLALNGMKPAKMPKLTHSSAGRMDLRVVGEFLTSLTLAGAPVPWTEGLMEHLFRGGGLPMPEFDAKKLYMPQPSPEARDSQWRPAWGDENKTMRPEPAPPKEREHVAKADQHTGAMIALYPDLQVARELAQTGGEDPEEIHLTLAYLGTAADLEDPARLADVVRGFAASTPPLSGRVQGSGRFDTTQDGACLYAGPDIPGVDRVRHRLVEHLEHAGYPPSRDHAFTPHMTLAYGPAAEHVPQLPGLPLEFTHLSLVLAGERHDFPLASSAIVKADEDVGQALVDRRPLLARQLEQEVEAALSELGGQAAQAYGIVARGAHTPREADRLTGSVMAKARVGDFARGRLTMLMRNHAGRVAEDTQRILRGRVPGAELQDPAVKRLQLLAGHHLRQRDLEPQVRAAVKDAITEGLAAGEGPASIGERIRAAVPAGRFRLAGAKWRAQLIANEETNSLQRHAALEAYRTAGVTHVNADGHIIPIEEALEQAPRLHPAATLVYRPA